MRRLLIPYHSIDLLEKARVIRQAVDERSFHIFYQLLASASPAMQQQLLLNHASAYRFLSNGMIELPGIDEQQFFRETTEAMDIMGINNEDQNGTFNVVNLDILLVSANKMLISCRVNLFTLHLPNSVVVKYFILLIICYFSHIPRDICCASSRKLGISSGTKF